MVEREKVIEILGACGTDDCDNCPLNGDEHCSGFVDVPVEVLMDALSLLKEQEPRVMTVEEIRSGTAEVVWLEDADKPNVIPGIWFRLSNEGGDESVDIHVMDGFIGARLEVYGKLWRCWSARPTEEQRKAVKWE